MKTAKQFTLSMAVLFLALAPAHVSTVVQEAPPLIPMPAALSMEGGGISLPANAAIAIDPALPEACVRSAEIFAEKMRHRFDLELETTRGSEGLIEVKSALPSCPCSTRGLDLDHEEGYVLEIDGEVNIKVDGCHGLHNAFATLLQLVDDSGASPRLPGLKIADTPRFGWRGMLLDSSRTFLPPDAIKRYIDLLSELKINVLHFHLVDDQGWRIESEKFPRLHEVGGIVHNMNDKKLKALADVHFDEMGRRIPNGRFATPEEASASRGWYSQEEIKELVAFGQERFVTIVPEIDVPGHTSAMIAAYPELNCSNNAPVEIPRVGQLARNALCPGKEEVYEFLDELFGEIAGLFPSEYVHIGGDEVWTTTWMEAPENQWLIEEYGYTDKAGLQAYFTGRVNEILEKHGKTMIAWDEVTDYAPEGAVIQAWRMHKYARIAAENGNDSIVSPTSHNYIDYAQLTFTLKNLYLFEPIPDGLDPSLHHHILGGEVNLWGERVTLENIDDKAFPRVIAHSEVMWSPKDSRDWDDFTKRLKVVKKDMKERGVDFGTTWRDIMLLNLF